MYANTHLHTYTRTHMYMHTHVPSTTFLDHQHVDYYSRTKSIAEQEVLRSNGREVEGGKALRTCAIRCAGIYGEGEQRHLPRIVVSPPPNLKLLTFNFKNYLI